MLPNNEVNGLISVQAVGKKMWSMCPEKFILVDKKTWEQLQSHAWWILQLAWVQQVWLSWALPLLISILVTLHTWGMVQSILSHFHCYAWSWPTSCWRRHLRGWSPALSFTSPFPFKRFSNLRIPYGQKEVIWIILVFKSWVEEQWLSGEPGRRHQSSFSHCATCQAEADSGPFFIGPVIRIWVSSTYSHVDNIYMLIELIWIAWWTDWSNLGLTSGGQVDLGSRCNTYGSTGRCWLG